ncbi:MAG: SBBP repeat-containing protein [Bacteroidetes bacterium]|nr:SBBP repeat-containing protein [Bacteroidota bacterium]
MKTIDQTLSIAHVHDDMSNINTPPISPFFKGGRTKNSLILSFIFISTFLYWNGQMVASAQIYQYAKSVGSFNSDIGYSIATDGSGNAYITGSFNATTDFDPGPGVANLTPNGITDIFLAKYDADGNYVWAKNIGSINGYNYGYDITVDNSGNVLVTGSFRNIVDFDPGPGTADLTSVGGATPDIFFAKYDANGNYVWAKNIGSTDYDEGYSIAVDSTGNVFITGFFRDAADFDPGAGTVILTATGPSGSDDIFFAKYDANGNYLWAKNVGSKYGDEGRSISIDDSGYCYLTGYFGDTADFDPGIDTFNLITALVSAFCSKYDANGNYLWAKKIGSDNSFGYGITNDGDGNSYVTGYFSGTGDFDPGPGTANLMSLGNEDIFFAKYDVNGNYLWANSIGSTSYDYGYCIDVDTTGNVYLTGYFSGTADFDPGAGAALLTPVGNNDIYFAKYDVNGNYIWANKIGSANYDYGYSIAVDDGMNVFITGFFWGTADFDPGSATANLTNVGFEDIYFAKYCALIVPSINYNNVSCYGGNDGGATPLITDGVPPYTYNWSNGQTGSTATGLIADTFYVTVTTATGCSIADAVIITSPNGLLTSMISSPVSCNGGSNGSTGVSVVGGISPYSLQWSSSPVDTNFSVSGLPAGTFTVTVTDDNGCTRVDSVTVTQPDTLQITFSSTGTTCNGGSNGTATANVSGGASPYSYNWSTTPAQTVQTAINLLATTYTVTVTDNNNCTLSNSITISQPPAITINTNQANISCQGGTNGNITVNAGGGITPYQYSNNGGISYQPASTFSNLAAASYTMVVKDSNNCTFSTAVNLTEPTQLTFTSSQINVTCNGGNNGSITVNATGGVTTYQYSNDNGFSYQPSNVFNNLVPDTYSIVVKDANNCTATSTVILTEPGGISASTLQTDVTCNGGNDGSIVVLASGGVNPLQYSKNGGSTFQFSNSFNSLPADTYSVVVKDANNCMTTPLSVIITSPTVISISIVRANVSCYNGSDGSANANVNGGIAPYTYNWSNGSSLSAVSTLQSATYTVTVTDSVGCTKTSSVIITEPAILTASPSPVNIICNGDDNGAITVTAAGGTGSFQYSADSGSTWQIPALFNNLLAGTYYVIVKDSNNCTTLPQSVSINEPTLLTFTVSQTDISCNGGGDGTFNIAATGGITPYQFSGDGGTTFQSSNIFDSLAAGNYTIVVRDNNGCDSTSAVTLTEPAAITFTTSQTDVSCNGAGDGNITVSAAGGSGTLEYSDDGGNTYQFTNSFSNLSDGNYDIVVKDANNCITSPATVTITQPSTLTLSLAYVDPTCALSDATATVATGGGVLPYSYLWSNGDTDSTAIALNSGSYTVTVTDANGCLISDNIIVTEFVYQQDICIVTVDSLTKKNLVAWEKTPGMGTQGFIVYKEIFTNVYDSIGYVPYDSLSQYVDFASDPKTKAERYKIATMDSCGNISLLSDSHRTILLTASVGVNDERNLAWNDYEGITPIMQYRIWRGTALNNITLIDSVVFGTNLYADWDTLTGVDSLYYFIELVHPTGCTSVIKLKTYNSSKSNTASMEAPDICAIIIDSLSMTKAGCQACTDGTASVYASGGTGTLTYSWSNGGNTGTITGLVSDTFFVTITDVNGCSVTGSVFVDFLVSQSAIFNPQLVLLVYPNPAKDILYVEIAGGNEVVNEIHLVNVLGQEAETGPGLVSTNQQAFRLYVGNLPEGIYRLVVVTGEGNVGINVMVIK